MSPYVRTVKTASGATAVQVVWSNKRGKKDMDHIGSAHTPEDLEVLKTVARQRMTAGQDELDLGDGRPRGRALTIQSSRSEHLWEALSVGYRAVGLEQTCPGDEVFKQLVLARLIEPTSKLDPDRSSSAGAPASFWRRLRWTSTSPIRTSSSRTSTM